MKQNKSKNDLKIRVSDVRDEYKYMQNNEYYPANIWKKTKVFNFQTF